nr:hypothetical protein B0A51_04818 [Rachicladosporium sp. CCFEE 5018]
MKVYCFEVEDDTPWVSLMPTQLGLDAVAIYRIRAITATKMSKRLHTQDTTGSKRRRLNDSTGKLAPELSALDARATIHTQKLREWMEADRYAAFVKAFRATLPAEIRNVIQFYVLPRFPRPKAVRTDIEVEAKSQRAMFWVLQDLAPVPEPTVIDLSKPYHPPPSLQVSRATRHAAAEAYYASNIFSAPDAKTHSHSSRPSIRNTAL